MERVVKRISTLTWATSGTFILWVVYACAFVGLKNNPMTVDWAGYLSLLGEVGSDLIISILCFKLFKKTKERIERTVFFLFLISFIFAILADFIYNLSLNLLHVQYENHFIISLFDFPFAFFLIFQVLAWGWIVFFNQENKYWKNIWQYFPYVLTSVLIFLMFTFLIPWRLEYFSLVGSFQSLDTFLEVVGFALVATALARARTPMLRYFAVGYLLIISSDLIIRYHVIGGLTPYLSSFEPTWVLGLFFWVLGVFTSNHQDNKDKFILSPINSLQAQISVWSFALSLFSVSLLAVTCSFVFWDSAEDLISINKNLLSVLIPCSTIAIIASTTIATQISRPLVRLENMITRFLKEERELCFEKKLADSFIFEFRALENFVRDAFESFDKKRQNEILFARSAAQVVHDIQSPLMALDSLSNELVHLSQEQRWMIGASIHRIQEIGENLLACHRSLRDSKPEMVIQNSVEMIGPLLENLISEKKWQFKNADVSIKLQSEVSLQESFCLINTNDFNRVMSNLINNAVEAILKTGSVTVNLRRDFTQLVIEVKDNGRGIPESLLGRLGQGVSHGKEKGNGLGLQHAIACIRDWGGTHEVESEEGVGTVFRIRLPIKEIPDWMAQEIYFLEKQTVVIVDDDPTVFEKWKNKLQPYFANLTDLNWVYLTSPEELEVFLKKSDLDFSRKLSTLFLVDFHFGLGLENGLDLIERWDLQKNAVLITSEYPDLEMKERLKTNQVQMRLKKNIMDLSVYVIYEKPDLVLLDDKRLMLKTWELEAIKLDKKVNLFNRVDLLMRYVGGLEKSTLIYLDSDLGEQRGEAVGKILYNMGFENLYLMTGFEADSFPEMPWIKGILSKMPSFPPKPEADC